MANRLASAVLAVVMMLGANHLAAADNSTDVFRGKTITLLVGAGADGGYDTYARLVERHIGGHIPGDPSVIVENMPGASSLNLTNFLFNSAPRDGTTIGIINQAIPAQQRLLTGGARYDAEKLNWIGRVSSAVELGIVWHTAPVNTIQDVFRRVTIMGGTGPTSSSDVMPYLLNNLAGTKFKVVSGYPGTTAMGLAMERGEIEGTSTPLESLTSNRVEWVRDKKIKILVQYASERDPEIPTIPTMVELGKTAEDRQILGLFASSAEIGRSIVAPPGIPPATVTMLRRAFDAMLTDPLFLDEAKRLGIPVKPLTGEQLQAVVERVEMFPSSLIEKAREAEKRPN